MTKLKQKKSSVVWTVTKEGEGLFYVKRTSLGKYPLQGIIKYLAFIVLDTGLCYDLVTLEL